MKKLLKFLHILGTVGLTGALTAYIVLLSVQPEPTSLAEYAAIREAIGALARYLLMPSLLIVLASGLLSIAVYPPFREARWVWAKVLLGLSMFEGTLGAVQAPAERAAKLSAQAVAGEIDPAALSRLVENEWNALWLILTLATVNILLGVWRPRLRRRRAAAPATS